MITVIEHPDRFEVECGHCGTLETADCHKAIAGFVLTTDAMAGVHCCWCGRDAMGLLEAGDELPSST